MKTHDREIRVGSTLHPGSGESLELPTSVTVVFNPVVSSSSIDTLQPPQGLGHDCEMRVGGVLHPGSGESLELPTSVTVVSNPVCSTTTTEVLQSPQVIIQNSASDIVVPQVCPGLNLDRQSESATTEDETQHSQHCMASSSSNSSRFKCPYHLVMTFKSVGALTRHVKQSHNYGVNWSDHEITQSGLVRCGHQDCRKLFSPHGLVIHQSRTHCSTGTANLPAPDAEAWRRLSQRTSLMDGDENTLVGAYSSFTIDDINCLPTPNFNKLSKTVKLEFDAAIARMAKIMNSLPLDAEGISLAMLAPKLLLQSLKRRGGPAEQVEACRMFPDASPDHIRRLHALVASIKAHAVSRASIARRNDNSLEARAKRCYNTLLRKRSLSRAVRNLLSEGVRQADEAAMHKLVSKHPPCRNPAALTSVLHSVRITNNVAIKPETVVECLRNMDSSTATGIDGWSVSLLRFVCGILPVALGGEDDTSAVKEQCTRLMLVRWIEAMASNKFPEKLFARAARLIPLAKGENDVRPIACGSVIARLAGRVVIAASGVQRHQATSPRPPPQSPISRQGILAPSQWGVGVGSEIPIHYMRLLIDSGKAQAGVKLDGVNAFNEVSRAAMLREVSKHCPHIYNYVKFRYGSESKLFVTTDEGGVATLQSREGTQQGDPLGGFFMSLVLAKHVRALHAEFPDAFILSYLDDVFVFSSKHGQAGIDKCRAVRQRVMDSNWRDDGLIYGEERKTQFFEVADLVNHPVEVLGSWLLAPAELYPDAIVDHGPVFSKMKRQLEKKTSNLDAIAHLPKQVALLILRTCCLPVLQHWVRTMPPSATSLIATQFDEWIEQRLVVIMGCAGALSAHGSRLMHLPLREGGLGFLPQASINGLAYGASFVAAWRILMLNIEVVQKERDSSADTFLCTWATTNPPNALTELARLLEVESSMSLFDENILKSATGLQSVLTTRWGHSAWEEAFFAEGITSNLQYRMLDFGGPLGRAWMYRAPIRGLDKLKDSEVSLALKYRLNAELPETTSNAGFFGHGGPQDPWTPESGVH